MRLVVVSVRIDCCRVCCYFFARIDAHKQLLDGGGEMVKVTKHGGSLSHHRKRGFFATHNIHRCKKETNKKRRKGTFFGKHVYVADTRRTDRGR